MQQDLVDSKARWDAMKNSLEFSDGVKTMPRSSENIYQEMADRGIEVDKSGSWFNEGRDALIQNTLSDIEYAKKRQLLFEAEKEITKAVEEANESLSVRKLLNKSSALNIQEGAYVGKTYVGIGKCMEDQRSKLVTEQDIQKVTGPLSKQEGGSHYKTCKIQPVEYIHANKMGYCEGAVVKYITRYKAKNGKEDLLKARHFIDLLIELEYK